MVYFILGNQVKKVHNLPDQKQATSFYTCYTHLAKMVLCNLYYKNKTESNYLH